MFLRDSESRVPYNVGAVFTDLPSAASEESAARVVCFHKRDGVVAKKEGR